MKVREAVPLVKILRNDTVQAKPYTLVAIEYEVPKGAYWAYGFSKCSPRDDWNSDLGVTIARNRAVFAAAADIADSSSGACPREE